MNIQALRNAMLAGATAAFVVCGMTAGAAYAGSAPKGTPAGKAEPGSNSGVYTGKPAGSVVALDSLALQLSAYGQATKDPVALALAAKMMKAVGKGKPGPAPVKQTGTKTATRTGAAPLTTPDQLLAAARKLAHGNKTQLAMIDSVAKEQVKGDVDGPQDHYDRVLATGEDEYHTSFVGHEVAEIGLSGDHTTDLDLYVYDQNGNLICQSISSGDTEYCNWTPRWTGPFTIHVVNRGNVYNDYEIIPNCPCGLADRRRAAPPACRPRRPGR